MDIQRESNPLLETLTVLLEDRVYGLIISLVVIPLLALAALWLPPISLGDRVLDSEYTRISTAGGAVNDPDGTQVAFLSEGLQKPIKAYMTSVPRLEFLAGNVSEELRAAAAALPPQLVVKSPIYQVHLKGAEPSAVVVTIPIPNDAEPHIRLDVYEWTGEKWAWLPHKLYPEDEQLEVRLDRVPRTFAVVQAQPTTPSVGAEVQESADFVAQAGATLVEASPRLYMMNEDGTISQLRAEPAGLRESGAVVVPVLHNQQSDGVIRSDLTDNLLIQPDVWQGHVDQIVGLVNQRGYAGIEIDYREVDPELRSEFTAFVRTLADRLHDQGKLLIVRVPTPRRISEDEFDSGAYDLTAIGQAADQVRLTMPLAPQAWQPGGDVEALLTWVTGKVNRYKLALVLPAASYDVTGTTPQPVSYDEALATLGRVQVDLEGNLAAPGQPVRLLVTGSAQSEFDQFTQTYRFTFTTPDGQTRTLLLNNVASLARKLDLISRYTVGGVVLQDAEYADPRVWALLAEYRQGSGPVPFLENRFAVVWRLKNERGEQVAGQVQPLNEGEIVVRVPEEAGTYRLAVAVSDDGGATTYGEPVEQEVIVPTPSPTPEPTPTPTPTPVPTPTPRPAAGGGGGGSSSGGRGGGSSGGGGSGGSTSPPPPPSTAPTGGPMIYGIQAHLIHQDKDFIMRLIQGLGFTWVKQQIEWKIFEPAPGQIQWGEMDAIVDSANRHGIKVLFSIVKAPKWARPPGADFSVEGPPADPQTYANFVRAVAARYCGKGVGAIEVWNEQNLHYEWGNQPLNAADYMTLLKVAYRAIKEVCPSMVVVSGALTPAGNVGNLARDDIQYLQEMYKYGLKQYSDAIGAHPSGYNCPADADWRTVQDPTAKFRGPFENRHHSWCFRGTMEGYRNVMVANGDARKKIWVTEFGWASSPNPVKGYEYAADNTLEEQAKWTVQAFQMARNWGWVGAMFLWNLNFKMVAPGSEQAQWGIVDEFGNPLPTYHALAAMPKR